MKKKAFVLLEVSCSVVLFLMGFLSFFSFQREILLFLYTREKQYHEKWKRDNAIVAFRKSAENGKIEEGDFYYDENKWSLNVSASPFLMKVTKEHLKTGEKEEEIYYYQMFDTMESNQLWEGWSLVSEK